MISFMYCCFHKSICPSLSLCPTSSGFRYLYWRWWIGEQYKLALGWFSASMAAKRTGGGSAEDDEARFFARSKFFRKLVNAIGLSDRKVKVRLTRGYIRNLLSLMSGVLHADYSQGPAFVCRLSMLREPRARERCVN